MDFFVRIYMRVCKKRVRKKTRKAGKNASIRDKKTHVYSVAGMIASIRGKKPHVYRAIILKQMADHRNQAFSSRSRAVTAKKCTKSMINMQSCCFA